MKQHKFLLIFMVALAPTLLAANVDTTEMSFSFEPASMNLQVFKKDVITVPAAMRIQASVEAHHLFYQIRMFSDLVRSQKVEDLPTLIGLAKHTKRDSCPVSELSKPREQRPVH